MRALIAGLQHGFRWLGYELKQIECELAPRDDTDNTVAAYRENPEVGPVNLTIKQARVAAGGPFEYADIIDLNKAIAGMVPDDHYRIAELGGGTGLFAIEVATDTRKTIVCSELDAATHAWTREHRNRPNIRYINRLPEATDGPFDLVVAIEVIEHVADYRSFLETCVTLASQAIISTPNKSRSIADDTAGPPAHPHHVREWTAGEFYWILRLFYRDVALYTMTNSAGPSVIPISIISRLTPVIAVCSDAYGD